MIVGELIVESPYEHWPCLVCRMMRRVCQHFPGPCNISDICQCGHGGTSMYTYKYISHHRCMCIYIYIYMYTRVCICIYIYIYIHHMYVRTYVCTYVCMYVCMYVCVYLCIYVTISTYLSVCASRSVCKKQEQMCMYVGR